MQLSAIIITRNEQYNIEGCLKSLDFADECIVLDNASTDNTVQLARSLGASVHVMPDWPGFGRQKNRALALAQHEWVLSIDADERVTTELRNAILVAIKNPNGIDCFSISRSSWFCGRFIRHSGWSPDYVARLFRKGTAKFSDDLVHERLLHHGVEKRLNGVLLHYSFRSFSDVLQKVDQYSTASAKQAHERGQHASIFTALGHGIWSFIRVYFLKFGFLDGAHGLALAISSAEGSYYRYLKLWQMTEMNKLKAHL